MSSYHSTAKWKESPVKTTSTNLKKIEIQNKSTGNNQRKEFVFKPNMNEDEFSQFLNQASMMFDDDEDTHRENPQPEILHAMSNHQQSNSIVINQHMDMMFHSPDTSFENQHHLHDTNVDNSYISLTGKNIEKVQEYNEISTGDQKLERIFNDFSNRNFDHDAAKENISWRELQLTKELDKPFYSDALSFLDELNKEIRTRDGINNMNLRDTLLFSVLDVNRMDDLEARVFQQHEELVNMKLFSPNGL